MKFPVTIRHRSARVKIYGPSGSFAYYRAAWTAGGKAQRKTFPTYSEAKLFAERTAKEIATGSQAPALTPAQARDALAALQRLDAHRTATGHPVGLLAAVSAFCDAEARLAGRSLAEAVEHFLTNGATLTRKPLTEAVEEFIALRAPQGIARDGKRAARSPVYLANVAAWLREFAAALPGHDLADLTRAHLDAYLTAPALARLAPKSRNDRRNTLKMFLRWCVRKDWLPVNHRLLDADGLARESVEAHEPEFYTAAELRRILDGAAADLRPVLALQALAGLRVEETMRLRWGDVFRVAGHIEVRAAASKIKQRRLVPVGDALARWLEPCRGRTGPVWPQSSDTYHARFAEVRAAQHIPTRENGLRHGYASHRYALASNENLVAAEMGTSAAMLFKHYRGLCTPQDGAQWFAVAPAPAADNIVPISQGAAA